MKTIPEIIERLKAGNDNFVKDCLESKNQDSARRKAVINGQNPFAIVLSCADSRVVPEFIFDTGIGELFIIRVAGNVANTSTIASIEYAVAHLATKVLIVLGHQSCGAVTAAVKGGDNDQNINHLLHHLEPAIEASEDDASVNEIARKNAIHTVQHLTEQSAIIKEAFDAGQLEILPAYYRLDSGKVEFL